MRIYTHVARLYTQPSELERYSFAAVYAFDLKWAEHLNITFTK